MPLKCGIYSNLDMHIVQVVVFAMCSGCGICSVCSITEIISFRACTSTEVSYAKKSGAILKSSGSTM